MQSRLFSDPDLVRFYDRDRPRADFRYCARLAGPAASVLDLGCGTGQFAASLGGARHVTGVDPSAAMLDVARTRPGGRNVTWLQADARSLRLNRQFDLIVLTGHSFQVFLSDDDQARVLATICAHLGPEGRFVFDSRNPDCPAPKERSRDDNQPGFTDPVLGAIEPWNTSRYDAATGILHYTNGYVVRQSGREHSASASIRYSRRAELAGRIRDAELRVDRWLGDWGGAAFRHAAPEIIPIGGRVR